MMLSDEVYYTSEQPSDVDEDPDVSQALRQLRHNHETLLREKREMEQYCQEVELEAQRKEQTIESLKGMNEALSRDLQQTKLQTKLTEETPEPPKPKRGKRQLPISPRMREADSELDETFSDGVRSTSGLDIASSQGMRGEFFSDDEYSRGGRFDDDDEEDWNSFRNIASLDDELCEAVSAVDKEELIQLAQSYNSLKTEHEETLKMLRNREIEDLQVEEALQEQERLQHLLDKSYEKIAEEKAVSRKLQDLLDEATIHSPDSKSNQRKEEEGETLGDILGDTGGLSLAEELAKNEEKNQELSWQAEREKLMAEMEALKEELNTLKKQMSELESDKTNLENEKESLENKLTKKESESVAKDEEINRLKNEAAELVSQRQQLESKCGEFEAKLQHVTHEGRERRAADEHALATAKGDIEQLNKQVASLQEELKNSQTVAQRQREDSRSKLKKSQADFDKERKSLEKSHASTLNLLRNELSDNADKLKAARKELLESQKEARLEASKLNVTINDAKAQAQRYKDQIDKERAAAQQKIQATKDDLAKEQDNEIRRLQEELENLITMQKSVEADLTNTQQNLIELSRERNELQQQYDKMNKDMMDTDKKNQALDQENTSIKAECTRLQKLVEEAGSNIKDHLAFEEMSIQEIERLRGALEHAEITSRRAREWVERTEKSHEADREKIINRADKEIQRQRALVEEANSQLVKLKASLALHDAPLNLDSVTDALTQMYRLLGTLQKPVGREQSATPKGPVPYPINEHGDEIKAVTAWLQDLKDYVVDIIQGKSNTEEDNNEEAATDTVSRLLKAVKRFHSAQMAGQALGRRAPVTSGASKLAAAAAAASPAKEDKDKPATETPKQTDAATSFSALSIQEQEELHRDWKRLKNKVRDLSTRLRSAKAAVAVGRYREETQKVYIRNRDRLVMRILRKPPRKERTLRLLKILADTSV
eukprot:m.20782 g.20782  ORF g.20782 m.20782 type:complete len:948 (+) comp6948_c0_seq1:110-2953(+)